MPLYHDYMNHLKKCLDEVIVSAADGSTLSADEGLNLWCTMTGELKKSNNTMFFAGNGGSAMMASHMAADASKNGGFRDRLAPRKGCSHRGQCPSAPGLSWDWSYTLYPGGGPDRQ